MKTLSDNAVKCVNCGHLYEPGTTHECCVVCLMQRKLERGQ